MGKVYRTLALGTLAVFERQVCFLYWDPNSGLLQEECVLLATEPLLQPMGSVSEGRIGGIEDMNSKVKIAWVVV